MHKMTPAREMPAKARPAVEGELASLGSAHRVAQLAAVDGSRPARKSRPHRLLDLHLHQLASPASLCPRLGREIQGSRIGGDRRARARVPIREEHRQRSPGRKGHGARLSDRDRQRLCDMARFQEPILAGSLFCRCAGPCRDIITSARATTNSRKGSSRNCWPRPEPAASAMSWFRSTARGLEAAADWGSLRSPETYVGYERTERFASPGGAVLDKQPRLCCPRAVEAQSLGAFRRLDREEAADRA